MAITTRTLTKNPLLLVLVLVFAAVPAYIFMNWSGSCSKQNTEIRRVVVQPAPAFVAATPTKAGFLGIGIETLNTNRAANLKLSINQGVLVTKVMANYPALQAGFLPNDVVTSINGKPVRTQCALKNEVSKLGEGTRVVVEVNRRGERVRLFPTLAASPLKSNTCSTKKNVKKSCRSKRR